MEPLSLWFFCENPWDLAIPRPQAPEPPV